MKEYNVKKGVDGDGGWRGCSVHIHLHVCLPTRWVTHEAFRCSPVVFSVSRGWDLIINSIIQHTNRNGSILCQRTGTNSDFWVPTWACVSRIRPNQSACWSSPPSQILPQPPRPLPEGQQSERHLPFPCFHFCGCFCCDWDGQPRWVSLFLRRSHCQQKRWNFIRWCVLNAALQQTFQAITLKYYVKIPATEVKFFFTIQLDSFLFCFVFGTPFCTTLWLSMFLISKRLFFHSTTVEMS